MCENVKDHCWSSWTSCQQKLAMGLEVWFWKRYCYSCGIKEWV